jgi:predicted cupin superfamily sugar epimerase
MTGKTLATGGSGWIQRLGLEAHPEGGWFRRIYTSPLGLSTPQGTRPAATSIHYLLTQEQPRGFLHRNRSDILHFLIDGGPLEYLLLDVDGGLHRVRLECGGQGEHFLLVPGGRWKASQLIGVASHALVAEVVTPGFDYADHQFATIADIERHGPPVADALRSFCRD